MIWRTDEGEVIDSIGQGVGEEGEEDYIGEG